MQRPEPRPLGIVARATFALLAAALLTAQPAVAATFTVTSTQCEGEGSITEAMDTANNTPGEDTITFTPGLRVDAGTCPTDTICVSNDPGDCFFL
jgi:hypothetical protein